MAINNEFSQLYCFLDSLCEGKQSNSTFFTTKEKKYQTISSKLATLVRPSISIRRITEANPFKMYPEMTGILNLRSAYQFIDKDSIKSKETALMASSQ
jgi:5-bromo-4-chloroindolyl phosphate hydrolysis protein